MKIRHHWSLHGFSRVLRCERFGSICSWPLRRVLVYKEIWRYPIFLYGRPPQHMQIHFYSIIRSKIMMRIWARNDTLDTFSDLLYIFQCTGRPRPTIINMIHHSVSCRVHVNVTRRNLGPDLLRSVGQNNNLYNFIISYQNNDCLFIT